MGKKAEDFGHDRFRRAFVSILSASIVVCLSMALAGCHKARSVTLNWQPPPAHPGVSIVAYNVYRSTFSGRQFALLASHVPGPPYEDRLVTNGRTYFYVVTAIDKTGRESRFSDEVKATIP